MTIREAIRHFFDGMTRLGTGPLDHGLGHGNEVEVDVPACVLDETVEAAILADWQNVGRDLSRAVVRYDAELSTVDREAVRVACKHGQYELALAD